MRITASRRSALIRLASSLPQGSEERRVILTSLQAEARKKLAKEIAGWNYWDPSNNFLMRDLRGGEWDQAVAKLNRAFGKPVLWSSRPKDYPSVKQPGDPKWVPAEKAFFPHIDSSTDDGWYWAPYKIRGDNFGKNYVSVGKRDMGGMPEALMKAGLLDPADFELIKAEGKF